MFLMLLVAACTRKPHGGDDSQPTETGIPTGTQLIDDTVPTVLSSVGCDACGGDCLLEGLEYGEHYHTVEPIDYASTPPAGGPHNPCWAIWGVHDEAVLDDNFVHNLEHGGVAFVYADESLATPIGALAKELGDYMITTPYAAQKVSMTAMAWDWRLSLGCFDDGALRAFYKDHVNQGPESLLADPSAGCM